jgi:D-ribose pyranose/furanose isomerase RbsD
MQNIDKIKCVLIDFEQNDKTLDEAANEILRLFSVVGQSEQLKCEDCGFPLPDGMKHVCYVCYNEIYLP